MKKKMKKNCLKNKRFISMDVRELAIKWNISRWKRKGVTNRKYDSVRRKRLIYDRFCLEESLRRLKVKKFI